MEKFVNNEKLDEFLIIKKLGEGGFGTVSLAYR